MSLHDEFLFCNQQAIWKKNILSVLFLGKKVINVKLIFLEYIN